MGKKTDRFDKIQIILKSITTLSIVAIPLIISFYSNRLTEAINNKELNLKYVELSIKILSDAPRDSTSEKSESDKNDSDSIRQWAVDVINKFSPIPMTKSTKDELKKKRLINIPKSPTCSLIIQKNEKNVTLSWSTSNATSVEISGIGPVGPSGTRIIDINNAADNYTLIAIGAGGTTRCRRSITD